MSNTSYSLRPQLSTAEREQLGAFSDISAHLLFHRGVTTNEEAQKFISPDYDRDIHDPFLLKDAEKAAQRILEAIEKGENIVIYSDYDADGIPGAVMFADFFRRVNVSNFTVYIPHRHDEGFGLHVEAVEELHTQGARLIITIDCGITDVAAVTRARELGIDVIITDHHEPPALLPPAYAIVNHKQIDCAYPDKHLCGSGTAFKLVQAILKKDRRGLKEGHEKWLLDMVGIATLSDMVPLTGENRALAHYGLAVLRKSPRKGLVRLLSKLKINQRFLSEDDVGFMITPRINAMSRMGVPMDAFHMLSTEDENEAYAYVTRVEEVNTERKGIVASLVKEVKKILSAKYEQHVPSVIVLGNPEWRPSLLGLVANSCAEEFDRPVFLWGRDGDNVIKGSCRSEGRTNIVELMRAVPTNVFTHFGGHKHSGGFAVASDQIYFLEKHLLEASTRAPSVGEREMALIDREISLDEIDWNLESHISLLGPFGVGNPRPLFLLRSITPTSVRRFGKTKDHVEIVFTKRDGRTLGAIAFFAGSEPWVEKVSTLVPVDLIASIEKSFFAGKKELRLRVAEVVV